MRKNFKKILSLLLAFVMTFGFAPAVFAQSEEEPVIPEPVYGTEGDFDYAVITTEDGEVYAELVRYNGSASSVTIPASFGGADLKVIGHEAFYSKQIESVTIPDGVEKIDSRAFSNCVLLDNIIFPDSIKVIGDYAFAGCYNAIKAKNPDTGLMETVDETGLTFCHLPASLETIGDFAFYGCELFTGNGTIASNVEGAADVPALLLPVTVKEIGSDAFSQCRSLVNVVIPEGVTDIKNGTFTDCAGLERLEIPSTVTHIGPALNGAFTGHNRLSEYEPTLVIYSPHCVIEDSPNMDPHVVVYGALHSTVQAFVDKINAEREDNFYKDYSDLTGIEGDIEYMQFVAIEVPGHDFEGTITVPTCTLRGFTTYICKQCKAAGYYDDPDLADTYIPHVCEYTLPLGHAYGEWSEALAPGCETIGSKYRICHRELTDTAGNVLYDENGNALLCGYRDNRQVPATGHSYIYKDTTTCTSNGKAWKECLNCGAKRDIQPHMAYGHNFDYENPAEVIQELVPCEGEGTPAVDGKYIYECTRCGLTKEAVKSAHPDENNDFYCDVCGAYVGTSDATEDSSCKCDCHVQVGLIAWFYKIKLFFWKLFGVSRICDCGAMHY